MVGAVCELSHIAAIDTYCSVAGQSSCSEYIVLTCHQRCPCFGCMQVAGVVMQVGYSCEWERCTCVYVLHILMEHGI